MNPSNKFSNVTTVTRQTKSFSMVGEDVEAIEALRQEENLISDSAALRLLIREGLKYRALRRQAEREMMGQMLTDELTHGKQSKR